MSLFGSLITGVSALSAQAQAMGMISNNIANVSTTGYKLRDASFESLVTSDSRGSTYTPGSVLARAVQKIDAQGALQQTNSTTDIAISGNGFFVVQRAPTGLQESLFTRAGSFSEDSNGFLRNTAGFYLMGWRLDGNGNLPAGRDDISSTEAVNVSLLGGLTKATTKAEFNINLNGGEKLTAYPVSASAQASFKRTLKVYDSLGEGQDLELQFTHHTSPTGSSTSAVGGQGLTGTSLLTATTGVDAGETINVQVGGASVSYTITATSTAQNLIDAINNDPAMQQVGTAQLIGGQIQVIAKNFGDSVSISNGLTTGAVGAATALGFSTMAPYNHTTGANGINFTPTSLLTSIGTVANGDNLVFTVGTGPTAVSDTFTVTNTSTMQDLINQINTNLAGVARADLTSNGELRIVSLDDTKSVAVTSTSGTAATQMGFTAVASTTPTPPNGFPATGLEKTPNAYGWWELKLVDLKTGTTLSQGSLNFNSDGTLNAIPDAEGLKEISLNNINWGNGSGLQNIKLDISGMTQFSGEYNVTSATQNGAPLGLRTGVEIDRNGIVTARFSNGQTSALFKLPMATFTSPNNLSEQTGNAFTQTSESGSYNLREAGDGGAGLIEGSAVESSNVDIAEEFTKMIVTQRAYSAGTKVIRTADDMTEELLRLR